MVAPRLTWNWVFEVGVVAVVSLINQYALDWMNVVEGAWVLQVFSG